MAGRKYNNRSIPLRTRAALYARWFITKNAARVMVLGQEYLQYTHGLDRLRSELNSGKVGRFARPLDDEVRINFWRNHREAFRANDGYENVRHRYDRATAILTEVLAKDASIQRLVNYSSSYAQLEQNIAAAYPQLPVVGVDSQAVADLNRGEFQAPNLSFQSASDPASFVREADLEGALFAHLHTAALWLPGLVEQTYQLLAERGCRYILVYEPDGFSRELGGFYHYSDQPRRSALYRQELILHNYPNMLAEAGFKVIRSEMIRPPHRMLDFRSLFLLAKRSG